MSVFLWLGFAGAWLLFAGPVYQAALELREEGFDPEEGEAFRAQVEALPRPERVSAWWWLLPPVAFLLTRRRGRQWREAAFALLSPGGRERFLAFQNKSAGWLIVGLGALCIAAKETAELIEHYEWSWWLLVPLLGAPFLASVGFTASRMARERQMKQAWSAGADGPAA